VRRFRHDEKIGVLREKGRVEFHDDELSFNQFRLR